MREEGAGRVVVSAAGTVGAMLTVGAVLCLAARAQENTVTGPPVGFVDVQSATVSGALEVTGGRAVVRGGGVITARDRTAELLLNRGGEVNVCATSSLHVTSGVTVMGVPPLLLALDRGAMEIRTAATDRDVVITPDLRFSIKGTGPLDLRLRVTPNGDTCVEHRGLQAPPLEIVDQFGDARYELRAGQHVLFEHGSLREVVDHESSPCGCPTAPVTSVARNGASSVTPAAPGAVVATAPGGAPAPVEAQHPFPAAESEGLAPENRAAAVPQTPAGVPHAQVSATMAYGAAGEAEGTGAAPATDLAGTAPASAPEAASASGASGAAAATGAPASGAVPGSGAAPAGSERAQAPPASSPTQAPAPAAKSGDLVHSIGHFFRRLFGGG